MRMWLLSLASLAAACGGGSAADDDDDTGADARPPCPQAAPSDGTACAPSDPASCVYEECEGAGIVRATCDGTTWSVTETACDAESCAGATCTAGNVCAANAGGAVIVMCRQHSCGDGPLTCACVCGEETECTEGSSGTGDALFTCRVDCGAEICP